MFISYVPHTATLLNRTTRMPRSVLDAWGHHTWYFVKRVLHTPVNSIIATKNGITAFVAILTAGNCASLSVCLCWRFRG